MESKKTITNETSKIALRTQRGIKIIDFRDITYCKADGRYTFIHLINGESILISRLLKIFENILPKEYFFRIHKSYLVNLDYIKEFKNSENNILILENNIELDIAIRRKAKFIGFLSEKIVLV